MVGCWVGAGSAYIVHNADKLVWLGEEHVELPVTGNGEFGAVGLHGQAITSTVTSVATVQA